MCGISVIDTAIYCSWVQGPHFRLSSGKVLASQEKIQTKITHQQQNKNVKISITFFTTQATVDWDYCCFFQLKRLTKNSSKKAADQKRSQKDSIYKSMGVVNSYAWKGYN